MKYVYLFLILGVITACSSIGRLQVNDVIAKGNYTGQPLTTVLEEMTGKGFRCLRDELSEVQFKKQGGSKKVSIYKCSYEYTSSLGMCINRHNLTIITSDGVVTSVEQAPRVGKACVY